MIFAINHTRTPGKRIISTGLLVSTLLVFISCQKIQVKETRYPTGEIRTTTQYVNGPNSEIILHGAQMDWFPNGNKASMDRYVNGVQQGYAFRWYPNGRLKSVVYFMDGYRNDQAKYWNPTGEIIEDPLTELAFLKPN